MKKSAELDPLAPRPNLDFSKGLRGKYASTPEQDATPIVLDPALAPFFPDSASVNRALHAFLAIDRPRKLGLNPPAFGGAQVPSA